MQLYNVDSEIQLLAVRVKNFPTEIGPSFDRLFHVFGASCQYFGISWMDTDGSIVYFAAVQATEMPSGATIELEKLKIETGTYLVEEVTEWKKKTESIIDVFERLTKKTTPSVQSPCIEWYQSDELLLCMVKMNRKLE